MIEFINVTKKYKEHIVLENLNFTIKQNDKIAILGKSGIGKSTILKLISEIEKPTSGIIKKDIKNIGYVFQEPRLLPWLSAIENIKLPLLALNYSNKKATNIAYRFLKKMYLEKFKDYFPSKLSGGMIQRVSIARAFAINPDILLLDEPFSALDSELKNELLGLTKSLVNENNIPLIYITHSIEEAKSIADTIFYLKEKGNLEIKNK